MSAESSVDPSSAPSGNRAQQLRAAIAALEANRAALGDAVVATALAPLREELATSENPAPTSAPSAGLPQRKQVTVLFVDLVGFTALADQLDAEEVGDVINALWRRLDDIIAAHGGRVDKHIGDAVMALWGAPVAREDDPEQAIRAALAIQADMATSAERTAIANLAGGRFDALQVRVGIHTGPVLLGEVGTTREFTALGDTVNIASRLEQAATPGEGALISAETYAQVRGIFEVVPREGVPVKGKAAPVEVYHVCRAKPRAFRLVTRGVEGIETHMIGRGAELAELQAALRGILMEDGSVRASAARPTFFTVLGDAGLGKSRLVHEFSKWAELLPEQIRYFKGRAGERMQQQPASLWRDVFAHRFQIREDDRGEIVRAKIEAGVADALTMAATGADGPAEARRRAHIIGQLAGFDFSGDPGLASGGSHGDADEVRERARDDLVKFFGAITSRAPAVLLLEDIHWADDSSLELIEHLAAVSARGGSRLLIICLARPTLLERRPDWGTATAAWSRRLPLRPLSRAESAVLVGEILQREIEAVPAALRELVIGGAEGNPFYLEELIKMLIERGVIVKTRDGHSHGGGNGDAADWQVDAARLAAVQVPPVLTGVLQARLDSLSPAERLVLQRAAVVGRKFWDRLVEHLHPAAALSASPPLDDSHGAVEEALALLRDREMIYQHETSAFGEAREYIFKHNLLRDVAYETVLLRERREYHRRVAEWLEAHGGERLGEYFGLIAEHFEKAGEDRRAATYLRRAGDLALRIAALPEAENSYAHALKLLPASEPATAGDRAACLVSLGEVHERLSYFAMADARLREGLTLARDAGDPSGAANALNILCLVAFRQGRFTEARALGEEGLRLAREIGDPALAALVLHNLGSVLISRGDYAAARPLLEEGLAYYQGTGDVSGLCHAWNRLGVMGSYRGDYAEAARCYREALRFARELGRRHELSNLLGNLGEAVFKLGDIDTATAYLEESLVHARESNDRALGSIFVQVLGDVAEARGDLARAERLCGEGIAVSMAIKQWPFALFGLAKLAGLRIRAGRLDDAAEMLGLALGHPATDPQVQHEAQPRLERLRELLTQDQLDAGMQRGLARGLENVVAEFEPPEGFNPSRGDRAIARGVSRGKDGNEDRAPAGA